MKIAYVVESFPVLSQTFVVNQIIGAIERGHEVHIHPVGIFHREDDWSQVHPIVNQYRLLERTHYSPSLPANYIWRVLKALGLLLAYLNRGSWACLPTLNFFKYGRTAYSLRLFYQAIGLLGDRSYDIVHCQFGLLGRLALIYRDCGLLQGKLITTFRGFDISSLIERQGSHIYARLFAEGDFFLANCEFFRQRAIELGCNPKKIMVHASGIDCRKFAYRPSIVAVDGTIRLVTVGRLVEKKGIEYGIRAIARLAKKYRNLEYKIVGDGSLREYLQNLINELKVGHIVKLLGAKKQEEIIAVLTQSNLFLAPCVRAASGDSDAPVNTLKEAMAIGLPVVSTKHGGIPELVEHEVSGFLVPERDVEALIEKIGYLIEHPESWTTMGKAGRTRVELKYDIKKLNHELIDIYQQLASPKTQLKLEHLVTI